MGFHNYDNRWVSTSANRIDNPRPNQPGALIITGKTGLILLAIEKLRTFVLLVVTLLS